MLETVISIWYFYFLIILISKFGSLELLLQKKKIFRSDNHLELPNKESVDEFKDFHYNSGYMINNGVFQKYEIFPCSIYIHALNVNINLNSACIRCETCLSTVDKINQTLIFAHKRKLPNNELNKIQIESLFNIICEHLFTNNGLRNVVGNQVIFDDISETNSISTNEDVQWKKHLKNRCLDLTKQMGAIKIYKHWKYWWDNKNVKKNIKGLEAILCKDNSTYFRDCRSIQHSKRQNLNDIENTKLKKKINDIFQCI